MRHQRKAILVTHGWESIDQESSRVLEVWKKSSIYYQDMKSLDREPSNC